MDLKAPKSLDGGTVVTWGKATEDYLAYRPDPPLSLYAQLHAMGVGKQGQRVLDMGTGTGALALQFARMGLDVVGTDIDEKQIEGAAQRASDEGLTAEFYSCPSHSHREADRSFDAVTANQCWAYFKQEETITEVLRLLRRPGKLVVSSFTYLPRHSEVAAASESLVGKYNPAWSGRNWSGETAPVLGWIDGVFRQVGMFVYDEDIPFTQETWRGRMRALRGMSASLPAEAVARFDAEHAALLQQKFPPKFNVPHRISGYVLEAT